MKKIVLLCSLVLVYFQGMGQQKGGTPGRNKTAVEVQNWGSRAVILLGDYWNKDVEPQVLQQMSRADYEYMKQHITEDGWPEAFTARDGEAMEGGQDALLARLKVVRVATFDNIRNGENFGKQAILLASYAANKDVIKGRVWKDFYILLDDKDVREKHR